MFVQAVYTLFWVLALLVSIFGAVGFFQFLRKITIQESEKKEWYRYVAPTLLAILLAWFGKGLGMNKAWQWLYIILVAVAVPTIAAFFLLRVNLEKKNERFLVMVAFLLLLNTGMFTCFWAWHYRLNHASNIIRDNGYDGGEDQENPHLNKRNWFLIPLWCLTLVVSVASRIMWKKTHTEQASSSSSLVDNEYLPF